jgi:twitching motility protein PilI
MLEKLTVFPTEVPYLSTEFQESPPPEGELYLRFYLSSAAEFALPAAGIREVMQQPVDKIASVPNASPLLLGAINLRGQVIWVADLGKFLEDTGKLSVGRGEIPAIVIESQDTILALAVERLGSMDWLDAGQLQAGTDLPDAIAAYVQGQWALEADSQQVLRLLDHSAILRSARWAA